MSDLPFDFSDTLEAFECPEEIIVYEKSGQYINGRWEETKQNERYLNCILLNIDATKQNIVPTGKNVDSGYCVMFPVGRDTLYVSYQQNSDIQYLQSYLLIDGLEYVVVNDPDTHKNAGFLSYFALRFKEMTVGSN